MSKGLVFFLKYDIVLIYRWVNAGDNSLKPGERVTISIC